VVLGVGVGLSLPHIGGGTMIDSGRVVQLLAGISAGLLSLIAIVFSLLFLVVQFASTSQTPRLAIFRTSPLVWHSFGLCAGVLSFAIVAAIVSGQHSEVSVIVPATATVLVLACIGLIRALQLAAFRSVQLAHVLHDIEVRGRAVIENLYPDPAIPVAPTDLTRQPRGCVGVRWPRPQGLLLQVDLPGLFKYARQNNCEVTLLFCPGDLLRTDVVVMLISGGSSGIDPAEPLSLLDVGLERTFDQDPRFAFRLLTDIGLRALSTAVNDQASAIQALDSIESLLRTLAVRDLDIGRVVDEQSQARVVLTTPDWETFVAAAVDELIESARSRTVRGRIVELLTQTIDIAPIDRVRPLRRRLDEVALL
jgi:uncharacterized membrane protein